MTLLVVDNVTHHHRDRRSEPALQNVSLDIAPGEIVAVLARRHDSRDLLVRIVAGILAPEFGSVRFDGHDLRERPAIGHGIGLISTTFEATHGTTALDHLKVIAQVRSRSRRARAIAVHEVVEKCDAADLLRVPVQALDPLEAFRIGLARALLGRPRLLVANDPTTAVGALDRDVVEGQLLSTAREGCAVLVAAADVFPGARPLSLRDHDGTVAGDATPASAPVVALRKAP
jgi:ABC-type multidrug transport system ATPase subunit